LVVGWLRSARPWTLRRSPRTAALSLASPPELERREPEVMAHWLQSGAREPDGPSAYLVR
jgi:hypothetical protein